MQAEGKQAWGQPNVTLLKTNQVWARLAKEATVIGTRTYKDRRCTVLWINRGMYRISNIVPPVATPAYSLIYFDAKSSMPVAWKQYDEQNHPVEEREVTAEQVVPLPGGGWYVAAKQVKETFFEYQDPKFMPRCT